MKVFVAGASGAIGQPLIAELIRKGHTVAGMTHSEAGAKRLREYGVEVAIANAFDKGAVEAALRASNAEAVIDELASIPKTPSELPAYAERDQNCASRAEAFCTELLLPPACAVTSSSRVDSSFRRRVHWQMRARRLL